MELSQNALTPCILHLPLGRSGLCGVNFEALCPRPPRRFREQARRCPNRLRLRAHARLAAWRRGSVVLVPLFAQLGGRDRRDSTVFSGADVTVSSPTATEGNGAASERRACSYCIRASARRPSLSSARASSISVSTDARRGRSTRRLPPPGIESPTHGS